VRCGS